MCTHCTVLCDVLYCIIYIYIYIYIILIQEPRSITLGTARKAKGIGAERIVEVEHKKMYIPILESLSVLLKNDAVTFEVL